MGEGEGDIRVGMLIQTLTKRLAVVGIIGLLVRLSVSCIL